MQSQGSGLPESRYGMSYSHSALTGDGVDLYGHGPDPYVLQHQHHIVGHGGPPGMSPTGHIGMGSPGQHHQHSSKRSADVAGLNLKQDPMVSDVTMSSIGMGHSTMDDGGSGSGGQNGSQTKKTPPPNGKKTKGRVKIKMEFIDNKLRRYTTFSKRKTGIMKKAYELSTLTGTQVMLLVASETGHVYTFATRKLQPMITSEAGKQLIQTCLNSPDPPSSTVDQRMSATGFEETELTYTLHDEDQKDSESDDGDDAASSDAASRSPSPADLERSSYSPDAVVLEQAIRAGGTHTATTTHSGHHQLTAGNNQLSSRILNHPSGSTTRGSAGGGGGAGRGTSITEPSVGHQTASYANGPRHATSSSCATSTTTTSSSSSSSSSVTTNHHHANSSGGGGGGKNTAVVSAPALVSCPVNLTPSQLASLAANLPALSGLSLPHLPRGTNFASLLASASTLLTGVGAVGGVLTGGGTGGAGGLATSSKSPASAAETSSRKHLPRLISLAHVGAALQLSNSAKDASIKSTTSLMAADQRSDSAPAGPGGGGGGSSLSSSSHPALNLQTATTTSTTTTTSTANRDKKGGGSSKSRAAGAKKNKK